MNSGESFGVISVSNSEIVGHVCLGTIDATRFGRCARTVTNVPPPLDTRLRSLAELRTQIALSMANADYGNEIFEVNPYEGHASLTQLEAEVLWEYAKLSQHVKLVGIFLHFKSALLESMLTLRATNCS